MHNKLFIADGAMAVAGGRNIGNEYFTQTAGANFIDLDTFVAGALIPRLASLFDQYWNSEYVRPIETVVASGVPREERQRRFEEATSPQTTPPPAPARAQRRAGLQPDRGGPQGRQARPHLDPGRGLRRLARARDRQAGDATAAFRCWTSTACATT